MSVHRGSRLARRLFALAAAALVATTSWAQNSVFTLAGAVGNPGYTNATGTAAQFQFTSPSGTAVDAAGNVYVADAVNNAIRKITNAGVVTTFAGSPTGVAGNADNTTGTSALFRSPQGIAIDGAGNLFVADTGNHAIRMITPGGAVTTLAGQGGTGVTGTSGYTNGTGTGAFFNTPFGLTTDRTGVGNAALNVFVADSANHAIRKIVVATGVTTTLAGPLVATTSGSTNGTLANARFALPHAITGNTAGTLFYVADTNNHLIRQIDVTGDAVTTLAGSGTPGYVENTGTAAQFNFPRGIVLSPSSGNILVADTLNHVIRSITPVTSAGVTSVFAGTPNVSGSTNGLATSARFSFPTGLAADATSQYIVDTNNQVLRKISPATAPSISGHPASTVTVTAGNTANFSVTATGNPPVTYQWQRSVDSGNTWNPLVNGAISGGVVSGATTNALAISNVTAALNGNQFRVIVSNGIGSDATSNVSSLVVNQVPVITNVNTNFAVGVNTAISATITATGSPTPTFNAPTGNFPSSWATFNTTTGVISGAPPNATGSPFSFSVTATNSAGTSAPVAFQITVQTGPSILTPPANQAVVAGQTATFSVSASSSPAITGYQWQFSSNSGATWTDLSDGAFPGGGTVSGATTIPLNIFGTTAAMHNYQFRVVVTNSVGSSTSTAALLTITQAPIFTSVGSTAFVANQGNTYAVVASGAPAPTYTLTGHPSFVSIHPTTGALTGVPSTSDIAGSPYFFTVNATNTSGTTPQGFTLTVSSTPLAPAISTHPSNRAVGFNQITTFTVVATGSPTPTYQWQRFRTGDGNFINLPEGGSYAGTLSDTLTINGVTAEMNGDLYRVVITNVNGTATSNAGQLTISIGTVFTTVAGQSLVIGAVDGTGSAARFSAPNSIAVDAAGNAYVADAANHIIRKVTPAGVVTTIAGLANISGSLDGTGNAARFNTPSAVAVDTAGIIYVADTGNHIIRTINSVGTVTTIAGTALLAGTADGLGANARFAFPSGIAVDSFGTIYIADTVNHSIRRITSGGIVTTFVPSSSGMSFPNGLAVDSSFNLYVADSRNHVIRKVTPGGIMTTFAGFVGSSGTTDGNGSLARFNTPQGVAVDSTGTVYVADTVSHTLRRISATGDVTTLAGQAGVAGSTDGSGSTVRFNQPYGVAVDSQGNLWIADTFSHIIRRSGVPVAPQITTQPSSQFGAVGGSVNFTVVASGTPAPGFQWQRQAAGTSGFVNLPNDATYSGANTATLTVSGITAAMNGDQFQVI
ncbi:MAG TPA: putative Ig domain-containing protein, partial [Opitutaceae bacterium]|nr:putative Ig domain-containing protein [Opitutaceae bacterium]